MALKSGADGVITEGRFAGRHIDEVEKYLEGLEEVVAKGTPPAAEVPPNNEPPKKTPEQILAEGARGRIDPLMQSTLLRLEADDEAAFRAEVSDYDLYAKAINELKKTISPDIRAQRGIHRTLYINVKSTDPRAARRLFEKLEEPETAEAKAAREKKEKEDADAAALAAAQGNRGGVRPAPPMARPTPVSRSTPDEPPHKSKLVATDKIRAFCRSTGQDVEQYLSRLEAQGFTQDQLESAGQSGKRAPDTSKTRVYDRKMGVRS